MHPLHLFALLPDFSPPPMPPTDAYSLSGVVVTPGEGSDSGLEEEEDEEEDEEEEDDGDYIEEEDDGDDLEEDEEELTLQGARTRFGWTGDVVGVA